MVVELLFIFTQNIDAFYTINSKVTRSNDFCFSVQPFAGVCIYTHTLLLCRHPPRSSHPYQEKPSHNPPSAKAIEESSATLRIS
jgi:hypothetical protein